MTTMSEVAVRWVHSLSGMMGGQKLYILGVAGYNKPIWDVLALQGEREEAGERKESGIWKHRCRSPAVWTPAVPEDDLITPKALSAMD